MSAFANLEPIDREATSSIIAAAIRDRIMDGSFSPGMQLGEAQLARSFGVSRGPVREAMQRLIQEGLLRNERHRGVFVVVLDDDDVRDVYRARGAIEREAAALLVRDPDTQSIGELQELVQAMDSLLDGGTWNELMDVDMEFHRRMVELSGSKRLSRMFEALLVETRMCLTQLESAYPRRNAIVAEHALLLEALVSGDAPRALRCVDEHLDHAVTSLKRDGRELAAASDAPG